VGQAGVKCDHFNRLKAWDKWGAFEADLCPTCGRDFKREREVDAAVREGLRRMDIETPTSYPLKPWPQWFLCAADLARDSWSGRRIMEFILDAWREQHA
jgi:hypothetical protein